MASAASDHPNIPVADPVPYTRIFTGADGETHFSDETLPFQLLDYALPAPPISVSPLFAAANVVFISSPAGWHGGWHPAPRRQFILVLVGELEVTVSDGAVRRFEDRSFHPGFCSRHGRARCCGHDCGLPKHPCPRITALRS